MNCSSYWMRLLISNIETSCPLLLYIVINLRLHLTFIGAFFLPPSLLSLFMIYDCGNVKRSGRVGASAGPYLWLRGIAMATFEGERAVVRVGCC
jgi:hypothetical protein